MTKLPSPEPFKLLSLFSGAGALDYGFELTGRFHTRACIELEPIFCRTLLANQKCGFISGASIINQDVAATSKDIIRDLCFDGKSPTGIIGGPPCETFSVRGSKKGLDDSRGMLVFAFLEWVSSLKPRFFLMENVPPLARLNDGATLSALSETARSAGYVVSHAILNAADFGAATKRQRLFLVGMLGNSPFTFPEPTHSAGTDFLSRQPYVTVGEALKGLPVLGWTEPGTPQGHIGVRHKPHVEARFAALKQGQQDNIRKRTRLHLQRPSPTLVAGNLIQTRSHIHPTEPRELTNRESARIHGFPDNFVFDGGHAAMGKQIANSVPIALAQALAKAISNHLDTTSDHTKP
jgi:DNA (cytosine-5)-methyltransferase 1